MPPKRNGYSRPAARHLTNPKKELADSLPLCHPNDEYLKDFNPITTSRFIVTLKKSLVVTLYFPPLRCNQTANSTSRGGTQAGQQQERQLLILLVHQSGPLRRGLILHSAIPKFTPFRLRSRLPIVYNYCRPS